VSKWWQNCDVWVNYAFKTCGISFLNLCLGTRQEESSGGDQSLHHPVPGQRGLSDQCLSQQCAAAVGYSGFTAAQDGVLHQPYLSGQTWALKHQQNTTRSSLPSMLWFNGSQLVDRQPLLLLATFDTVKNVASGYLLLLWIQNLNRILILNYRVTENSVKKSCKCSYWYTGLNLNSLSGTI